VGQEAAEAVSPARRETPEGRPVSGFENVAGNTRSSLAARRTAPEGRTAAGMSTRQLLPFKREQPGSAGHPVRCRMQDVGFS
jgi:hypothetical protein